MGVAGFRKVNAVACLRVLTSLHSLFHTAVVWLHSATFWTAVQAVGSIVALYFIYRQIAAARDVSAYQFLRSEDSRFESEEVAASRSDLARALILKDRGGIEENADAVCSYFEDLGLMLLKKITPEYFTWTMYCDEIINYWTLLKDYVYGLRAGKGDDTYYREFEYLFKRTVKLQTKLVPKRTAQPTEKGIRQFLDDELQVQVRPFTLTDLTQVMEIELCAFDVDAYSEHDFRLLYMKHSEGFVVAEILGRIVGYVVGYPSNGAGEIDSIAVRPQDRKLGIARRLMERILRYFKQLGIGRCSLEVRTTNQGAIRLYEQMGFHQSQTLPKYYKDGADAYQMLKEDL